MSLEVLVTDGDERAALAVVRSLGRHGVRVGVVGRRDVSLAGSSRFCAARFQAPDPLSQPAEYGARIQSLVQEQGITVVLPIAEPSMLALLAIEESLRPARIPFPPLATFRRLTDKAALLATAPGLGIAVPRQVQVDSVEAFHAALPALPFPVVAKPARSVGEAGGERLRVGVWHLADRAAAEQLAATVPAQAFPLLLQQRIVGPGTGVFVLRWNGKTVATFAHRRLREKPPSGGVSVYRESITADPSLVERSLALLAAFDWQSVAMVEYKVDAATGTPYLMEINGRFWGSLQLAIDAGVDFPWLLLQLARGEPPAPGPGYRTGIRSRWWWGDVDQLLTRLRRSDRALALPPGSPGKFAALLSFARVWWPGDRNEILHLDDPFPLVRETLDWFVRR